MKKFNPAIPRRMFWSDDVGGKSQCPRCSSMLENEHQVFVLAIRESHDIHASIVGNNGGYFCPKCPTIVLDSDTFEEFARLSFDREADAEYTVLGLVDLEAIPKDKRSLPIGGRDNPVPLVKFSNPSEMGSERKSRNQRKRKKRSKSKKHR